jgi:hypothetical protein
MPAHTGTVVVTAAELREAAHQLAASIEDGEYDALSPSLRCDLRHLTCQQLAWADALDPERAQVVAIEDVTVVRFPARIPVYAVGETWR